MFETKGKLTTPKVAPAKRFAAGCFTLDSENRNASGLFASISGSALSAKPLQGELILSRSANPVAEISCVGENFQVHKIMGDGKCMFRATVRALAMNKGVFLTPRDEQVEAEQLRVACHDALCRTSHRRKTFPDAEKQIRFGYGDIGSYCSNLAKPSFWGGEVEMMVITKMLEIPIFVYQSDLERQGYGSGYTVLTKFGEKYSQPRKNKSARRPVRLLYTGGNHYDLLV